MGAAVWHGTPPTAAWCSATILMRSATPDHGEDSWIDVRFEVFPGSRTLGSRRRRSGGFREPAKCLHKKTGQIGAQNTWPLRKAEPSRQYWIRLTSGHPFTRLTHPPEGLDEIEVLAAFTNGTMLPANGWHYIGVQGEQLVLRRKCSGAAVASFLAADVGARSSSMVVASG